MPRQATVELKTTVVTTRQVVVEIPDALTAKQDSFGHWFIRDPAAPENAHMNYISWLSLEVALKRGLVKVVAS
jgi:hypothetical protein